MANRLEKTLNAKSVALELTAGSKIAAIREVAALLQSEQGMLDYQKFCDELIERDRATSMFLGDGVALPHARTDCVDRILISAGRSRPGVDFAGQQAHLIFVIGTPRSHIEEYLRLVSQLVRALKPERTRERLLGAATAQDFVNCLTQA